ncbi:MAG: elongation factor G [Spirochaetaceae bacterium]|nr:MAG: elongation factor G [Spirochaetaceae bacterium]
MSTSSDQIRNIAITGHGSTGKTTLLEQILYLGGQIPKPETVEGGKTVSDHTEEETNRKISIHTALAHIKWKDRKINLLDTPGAGDFVGEVISALRVSEAALVLVAADAGVQIGTVQTWRRLKQRNTPTLVFINKMDKEHADFAKTVNDLKENFQANFVPVSIPVGAGAGFQGVVNLIEQKAYMAQQGAKKPAASDIPQEMAAQVEEYRQALVEAAAEGDDALMEKYFESETLSDEEIGIGLAKALAAGKVIPVFCGAALLNGGIYTLLDALVNIGPAPVGRKEPLQSTDGEQGFQVIDSTGSPSCFVFKTSVDQFSGQLSYIKVVTGLLTGDAELLNRRESKKEKISKVYTCIGKKLDEVDALPAGDIGVLTKIATAQTNDTLCSADLNVTYLPLQLPQPVHAVAINAAAKKDEDKLNQLLQRAAEEDMTFQLNYNTETKETVISGMGELHLDIIMDKIKSQAKIEMQTRVPKVAYRETIRAASGAEYQHKKQTGGHGQYAKVVLEIQPLPRGEQFKFVNAIVGGRISKGYIPGVEKGVLEGMEAGILAGYPVVDLEAKVVDGKMHPVDSSELAFKLASRGALRASLEKADPVLLEPVMNLTVFVEDQYLGDVLSDLSSRRGKVLGQEPVGGGIQEVKAQVPQAELLRYSIDLRSITSGTASFEIEFSHYSPITGKVADQVMAAAKAGQKQPEG